MINKKKLTDFHLEKSSALKKLESYSAYEEENDDEVEYELPKDFKYFKGSDKALKNKTKAQKKIDAKRASVNNFKKEEFNKVENFQTEDSLEYNNVADEWEDTNEFVSPLDFNYTNSVGVKNSKQATQKVNSVFIGTALKQIEANRKIEAKKLEAVQKEMDKKILENKLKAEKLLKEEERLKNIANLKLIHPTITPRKATIDGMGWSLNPFAKNYSSMTQYAVGIDYINKFHRANNTSAVQYVDGLYRSLGHTKTVSGIESLGFAIQEANMSESDVEDSANELARNAQGKVPATIGAWFYALQNQATQTPFVDAILNNPIVQATQKVGDTIIKAGETVVDIADSGVESVGFISKVNRFLPFVIPVAIGFVALKYFGGVEGIVKAMKKQNPSKKRKNT